MTALIYIVSHPFCFNFFNRRAGTHSQGPFLISSRVCWDMRGTGSCLDAGWGCFWRGRYCRPDGKRVPLFLG